MVKLVNVTHSHLADERTNYEDGTTCTPSLSKHQPLREVVGWWVGGVQKHTFLTPTLFFFAFALSTTAGLSKPVSNLREGKKKI